MKYYEDKTDKEIARILGISRQAVSKMKPNLLVKLKRIMEK
ncbi:helix-turn-helix transcriptional regulator [Paenibacillus terrae]